MTPVQKPSSPLVSSNPPALQSSQAHADAFSIGGFDAEAGVTLGVNLRVFLAGLIQRRGFEIVRDWLVGLGHAERGHE